VIVTAETLKLVPLFARLSDEQLAALANSVIASKFRRGAFVLRAGQDPDGLYVILSGRAKVFISDKEGGEVILATIGPGNYFGEMGLIGDRPRSASVQTLAPSELMFLSKADFLHYVAENPGLATCIMQGLVRRLQQADRQIESLALQDVVGRVSQLLLDLSERRSRRRPCYTEGTGKARNCAHDRSVARNGQPCDEKLENFRPYSGA